MSKETLTLEQKIALRDDNDVLLDILRCNPSITRTDLADKLEMSFPTASKTVSNLQDAGILDKESKDLRINPDAFWLCGISIGGSQTKITFIDAEYQPIGRERFDALCQDYKLFTALEGSIDDDSEHNNIGFRCFPTPNDISELLGKLDYMVNEVIKLNNILTSDDDIFAIKSIGIAITGSIDSENQCIVYSSNVPYLNNSSLKDLISISTFKALKDANISLIIDHNAKALAVCEKFSLYQPDNDNHAHATDRNIASLYLGSGLGCGLILGNRLMRGTSNFNGEIGKLVFPRHPDMIKKDMDINNQSDINDLPEYCGRLEDLIMHDIFDDFLSDFTKATSGDIIKKLNEMDKDPKEKIIKETKLKALGYYLSLVVDYLIRMLNVDLIIFSGKITCMYDQLWRFIQPDRTIPSQSICERIKSKYGAFAPTIGAAILSNYERNAEIKWYD